jgi:hypothetical protein
MNLLRAEINGLLLLLGSAAARLPAESIDQRPQQTARVALNNKRLRAADRRCQSPIVVAIGMAGALGASSEAIAPTYRTIAHSF